MTFHPEVLTHGQAEVLRQLGPLLGTDRFYLAGGTAAALHVGHRRSVDLDWFTGDELRDPLAFSEQLRDDGVQFLTTQVAPGTLHGTVQGVRVSFLEYRYTPIDPPVVWEECGCALASLDDLCCMKLSAVTQRGSRKDFVDVYALGVTHKPLGSMLELYRRKYGVGDIAHVLYGLAYFDDAEQEPLPVMLWDVTWEDIRNQIQEWVTTVSRAGSSSM
jgi:hypothetical protein